MANPRAAFKVSNQIICAVCVDTMAQKHGIAPIAKVYLTKDSCPVKNCQECNRPLDLKTWFVNSTPSDEGDNSFVKIHHRLETAECTVAMLVGILRNILVRCNLRNVVIRCNQKKQSNPSPLSSPIEQKNDTSQNIQKTLIIQEIRDLATAAIMQAEELVDITE
jgi:hypothetical protein